VKALTPLRRLVPRIPTAPSLASGILGSRKIRIAAAIGAGLLMLILAGAVRLAVEPIPINWLRPGLEHALAGQAPGGRARIDRVALAWFADEKALGLRLNGVQVTDARQRLILQARQVDAGLALDALPGLVLAPARLSADHFFAVVSVSSQGRYALGYDAHGAPSASPASDPVRALLDLTGKPKLGRAASYLRRLDLADGRLSLRQVGGPIAWTADIRRLAFLKNHGRLSAQADVQMEGADHPARVKASATAAVGLSHALVRGEIDDLRPALVFPSVGATESLSELDALMQGRGALAYDFKSGVQAADIDVTAGQGRLRFGSATQAFVSAKVTANYLPATREVVMSAFKVEAEKTRLDLNGRFRLVPELASAHRPAHLDYVISGPRFVWRLAKDSPPQDLFDVLARGRLVPQTRRLEIDEARGIVAGVPVTAHGVLFRDAQGLLGAQLRARATGTVGPDQIFAFWPQGFAGSVRSLLHRSVLGGRFVNADFILNAKPGHMKTEGLDDDELRLDFGIQDGSFRFATQFPPIEHGVGQGRVQGNRFDMTVSAGRLSNVALSEGTIEMANFRNHGADAIYRFRAQGGVRDILSTLDGPGLRWISHSGFSPTRTSGQADVRVEIRRPMLFEVPASDIKVHYTGVIHQGGVTQAALGWDLTNADLAVDGDEGRFTLKGAGVAGPYRGALDFLCNFKDETQRGELLNLTGAIDAGILGGPQGRTSPFAGRFKISGGVNGATAGGGLVHAAIFDGRVSWKDGNGPQRFVLEGWGDGGGLRRAGAPFTTGLPDRFPTRLTFSRSGDVWRGPLKADALSGNIVFTAGPQSRLVYETDMTPLKARRLGVANLPLFQAPRRVQIDAVFSPNEGGTANVRAGDIALAMGWNEGHGGVSERHLKGTLNAVQAAELGLPDFVPAGGGLAVAATWRDQAGGIAGTAQVADTLLRFQTWPAKAGISQVAVSADVDRATMRRLGLPTELGFDGAATMTARITLSERAPAAGRLDFDLSHADLSVLHTDWRKPAGRPARASLDFVRGEGDAVRLTRVIAQAQGLDVEGSAVVAGGRLVSADLTRVRLGTELDAAVRATREPVGGALALNVRGRLLDLRAWLHSAQDPTPPPAAATLPAASRPRQAEFSSLKLDVALDAVRLTDDTTLKDFRAAGVWGGPATTRLEVTAYTVNGGKLHGRLFPQGGFTGVQADTTDAGEIARGLFQVKDLKGGKAVINGRLVENGADLKVEVQDVRVIHAPAMAQLLTLGSFKGLADTMNGDGVLFTKVEAPFQIRGSRLILGEARATGAALGLTAEGGADMAAGKIDIHGSLAPAYSLNSAIGAVPVLGQILTSRKGEGVFALGYTVKGTIDKPQVMVNPLSLMTPGILRRMFEAQPAPAGGGSPSIAGTAKPDGVGKLDDK
jgi:hypothetical protein